MLLYGVGIVLHLTVTIMTSPECTTPEQPARLFCSEATPVATETVATPNSYTYCRQARVTGYVRGMGNLHTFDGTSIWTAEPIVAASFEIPLGSIVEIENLGVFRVADRGRLGSDGWVDVAVWSRDDAFAITGVRRVCVTYPRE